MRLQVTTGIGLINSLHYLSQKPYYNNVYQYKEGDLLVIFQTQFIFIMF